MELTDNQITAIGAVVFLVGFAGVLFGMWTRYEKEKEENSSTTEEESYPVYMWLSGLVALVGVGVAAFPTIKGGKFGKAKPTVEVNKTAVSFR